MHSPIEPQSGCILYR